MGKLVLTLPGGRTRDIPLDRERITIGRRADNDVCLPYPAVSGEHAAVVTILDDSFLEDLNSTNGTLVNGRPVAKHFLRDRDEIDIGRQVIVYVAGDSLSDREAVPAGASTTEANPAPVPVPSRTRDPVAPAPHPAAGVRSGMRIDTSPLVPEPSPGGAPVGVDSARPAGPTLEVLEGPGAGRVVAIDREVFVIGRVGVQLAAATRTADGLRLVHVEGDTPPRINGATLPEEGSLLALGDEIEIAGAKLRFDSGR
jgi:hypothetical protein